MSYVRMIEMPPIGADGRCTACGKRPARETGRCGCVRVPNPLAASADVDEARVLDGNDTALKLWVGKTPGQGNWLWPVTMSDIEAREAAIRAECKDWVAAATRGYQQGRADAIRAEGLDVERLTAVLNGMNLAPVTESRGLAETIARRYARLEKDAER